MLLGVCAGLGNYYRIDPTFIRLLVIFLALLTAIVPFILIYLIAACIIPKKITPSGSIKIKKLYRSKKKRFIAGVCGGVSDLLQIDVVIVRVIFIILFLLTGFFPLLIAYIIGWIIIPERPDKSPTVTIDIE